MRFYILAPFKLDGETITRARKYIDLDYEVAQPFIRRRQLMQSQTQPVQEVKQDEKQTKNDNEKPRKSGDSRSSARKHSRRRASKQV